MDIRKLTADLSVSPQITAADVAGLRAAGFRSIICNRPDGEAADQPGFAEIAAAARAAGIKVQSIPVQAGTLPDAAATEFAASLDTLPGPVLAYCRTGTRSTMLWALTQAGHMAVDDIVATAARAGYDLSALAPRLKSGA